MKVYKENKPISKKEQAVLDATMKEFGEERLVYAPTSVYHGIHDDDFKLSPEKRLKIQLARLEGFVDFLFNKSEHCDHISESDAWGEYQRYEFRTNRDKFEPAATPKPKKGVNLRSNEQK